MISFLNDKSFRNELAALEYHLEMSWIEIERSNSENLEF